MASDFDAYHRWLGIPPEEQPPDHYRLLGISRFESDREVISNASDQRMIHLRSFAVGKRSSQSQQLLNEVTAATHCLLDPAKKLQYDNRLRAASGAVKPQSARPIPVATPLSPQEGLPRRPAPLQPAPLPARPLPQAVATPLVVSPAANEFAPALAPRRSLRRSNKSGLTSLVAGLAFLALLGAGGIYAWRASQQVAQSPGELPNDNIDKPAVTPTPVSPENGAGKTQKTKSAADKNRRAWFYTSSPEGARGLVYHDEEMRWLEKTSDGRTNKFVEREVTADAVSLEDASRKLIVWLKTDQMTYSRNGSKERFCMKGEWVSTDDTSALLASLSRPALPEPGPETKPEKAEPPTLRRFTGSNVARLENPPGSLDSGKPLTVEFWYRRDSDFHDSCGLVRLGDLNVVLKRGGDEESAQHTCQLFSTSSGTAWNAARGWKANAQWHHLAICCDAGKLVIFHDGKPLTRTAMSDLQVESLEPLVIGGAISDLGSESFRGDIKSIRIADSARYRPDQAFTPPPMQADELLADASLSFSNTKETPPEARPPSLEDLIPGVAIPGVAQPTVRDERPVPPEGDELKAAEAAVESVYGERARMAQKPEDKQRLAAELLKTATTDTAAARSYALLAASRRLAVEAMDVSLALSAVNELDRRFDIDRVATLEKLLASLEKRPLPLPQREVLVDAALSAVFEAMKQDKVELADSLSVLATRSASKGRDPEKKKFALAVRERAGARKSAWQAMKTGQKKLAESPDDPAANLTVGRYLAFALDDFEKGCEHLIKGSDESIAAAAELQRAAQKDDDHLAAVEAWNGVLGSLKSPAEKLQLQAHILRVCQELAPRLTGLALAQAQGHIERLTPIIAEANKYGGSTSRSSEMAPGLIARVVTSRGGKPAPTPVVGIARTESEVFQFNNSPLMRPYLGGRSRYVLSGAVVVEKDMQVQLRFEDCTVTLLNERRIATSSRPINQQVMLRRGTYPIYIESDTFSFGFDVADADTGSSLLYHQSGDLEAELQRPGFDPAGVQVKSQRVN